MQKPRVILREGLHGPLPWSGAWPPVMPDGPVVGWTEGKGYPQRRCYVSSQGHDSDILDIHNMRHQHVELSHPDVVHPSVVRLDIRSLLFHMQGATWLGFRKFVTRTNTAGVQKWMPIYVEGRDQGARQEPITDHLMERWTPAYIDLRPVTVPGDYTFELDAVVRLPVTHRQAITRIKWKMWISDGTPTWTPPRDVRFNHGEYWQSPFEDETNQFGYMIAEVFGLRRYVSDPRGTVRLKAGAKVGRPVHVGVFLNPDLHKHPADYGTIVREWDFVATKSPFEVTFPEPPRNVGDRLLVQLVDASVPEIGSAAVLCGNRLCEG